MFFGLGDDSSALLAKSVDVRNTVELLGQIGVPYVHLAAIATDRKPNLPKHRLKCAGFVHSLRVMVSITYIPGMLWSGPHSAETGAGGSFDAEPAENHPGRIRDEGSEGLVFKGAGGFAVCLDEGFPASASVAALAVAFRLIAQRLKLLTTTEESTPILIRKSLLLFWLLIVFFEFQLQDPVAGKRLVAV